MGKVKIGDKAPLFKAESFNAGTIDLQELIGTQKIILIFSRYFGCPICQLDYQKLMERLTEIEEKDAKILFITQSGKQTAEDVIEEENIEFPVIESPKQGKKKYTFYKKYGLGMMPMSAASKIPARLKKAKKQGIVHGEYEGWEKQSPGQFVIDEEGKIIHAKKGWIDIDKILEVL